MTVEMNHWLSGVSHTHTHTHTCSLAECHASNACVGYIHSWRALSIPFLNQNNDESITTRVRVVFIIFMSGVFISILKHTQAVVSVWFCRW